MKFNDEMVSQEHRYAIGTATAPAPLPVPVVLDQAGPAGLEATHEEAVKPAQPLTKRYLSIPTTNGTMDYEEYYELTEAQFKAFAKDPSKGAAFAQAARERESEALLIIKPGRERGWAQ